MPQCTSFGIVAAVLALTSYMASCDSNRCPSGEVRNQALQACVVPKTCEEGSVLTDKNECVSSNVTNPLVTLKALDCRGSKAKTAACQ